ncbi:hypothetical protein OS493_005241 [Desmophyllum pertusum]|uniref:SCP domain-containing protein n=1 Tax=Desmophyllum pertusum TaxID=174260 RepID=A0A9W9Z6T2_9CNID|nr:hypothetical protein OS493_005241 [Desmophyllum pertusum]
MCDEAKAYAAKLAAMGTLEHSSKEERHGQGENLSYGCSTNSAQSIEEAVTNWYNEVYDPGYDFNNGESSYGTGHFTQVVWKKSTALGIGRAEGENSGPRKCAYIVARYNPAGNLWGQYQDNVLKGTFNAKRDRASNN